MTWWEKMKNKLITIRTMRYDEDIIDQIGDDVDTGFGIELHIRQAASGKWHSVGQS